MKVAFIVTHYWPKYDAVGNCVSRVISQLPIEYNIDVLCISGEDSPFSVTKMNGRETITYCSTPELYRFAHAKNKIYLMYLRIKQFLSVALSKNMLRKKIQKAIFFQLERDNPDIIIPCVYPVEGLVAAIDFKNITNRNVKVIPYFFDNFVDCQDYYRFNFFRLIHYKSNLRLMDRIVSECPSIIATPTFCDFFKNHYPEKDILYLEHPLLANRVYNFEFTSSARHCYRFLYAGSLVRNYITADYCILFLLECNKHLQMKVNFHMAGNAIQSVEKASNLHPELFTASGFVARDLLLNSFKDYDCFISIAEKKGVQFSSKIFDYISTGKPILHFYTAEGDINLNVLRKYPNCFCVQEKKQIDQQEVHAFLNFLKNSKVLDYSLIENHFQDADPKYVADRISALF